MPELRFSEFIDDVKPIFIGDAVKLQSGFAFSSKLFASSGKKLVTPKNFTKSSRANFNLKNTKFTSEEVDEKYLCIPGDLLILLTDLTPGCELLGKPIHLSNQDGEVLLNQRIVKIETKPSILVKSFLKQFLLSSKWHKRTKSTASGSTVKHSSNKILMESEINIGPVKELLTIVKSPPITISSSKIQLAVAISI